MGLSIKDVMTLILPVILVFPAQAAKKPSGSSPQADSLKREPSAASFREEPAESLVTTHHAISFNGRQLRYSALAGRMTITDSSGGPIAAIFYTAYLRQPAAESNRRPITFAFNGGPGASSLWLHLAAAGPRRALLGQNGTLLPGVDTLIDNEYGWLPFTDLVFVDPVGTGFSRAAPGVNPERFYTINGDIKTMAEFIRLFLTKNQRWTSPLFLAGESYGTFRAAGLAPYLQNTIGKAVEGIILISSVVNFQYIAFDEGNDLPYVLALPSYTAAAWFHKHLPAFGKSDLAQVLASSQRWAVSEYLSGLLKGSEISGMQRESMADTMAAFTGLPRQYLLEHGMRVSPYAFVRELLVWQNQTIGLLDGRTTGINAPPIAPHEYRDPSMFVAEAPLNALMNDYIKRELSFSTSLEYIALSRAVSRAWQWSEPSSQGYVDESGALREAMSVNKNLRLFAAMGYYDLTTPFMSQQYGFEHLASDSTFINRIMMKTYPAGHQIYTFIPSLKQLSSDIEEFVVGNNRK